MRNNDLLGVSLALHAGWEINTLDMNGNTVLFHAQRSSVETFEYLLEKGADIHYVSPSGHTCLFHVLFHSTYRDEKINILSRYGDIFASMGNRKEELYVVMIASADPTLPELLMKYGVLKTIDYPRLKQMLMLFGSASNAQKYIASELSTKKRQFESWAEHLDALTLGDGSYVEGSSMFSSIRQHTEDSVLLEIKVHTRPKWGSTTEEYVHIEFPYQSNYDEDTKQLLITYIKQTLYNSAVKEC